MKIAKNVLLICSMNALLIAQVNAATATSAQTIAQSTKYSAVLAGAAKNYEVVSNDLNGSTALMKTANYTLRTIVVAEVVFWAGVGIAAEEGAAFMATNTMSAYTQTMGQLAGIASFGAIATAAGIATTSQGGENEILKALKENLQEINAHNGREASADLQLRTSARKAELMSVAELEDYAKKTEEQLKAVPAAYKANQKSLEKELNKIRDSKDPSNNSYFVKALSMKGDEINYANLVKLSASSQKELALAFKKSNDDLRAELVKTNEIIESRH
jgi:hypothetical protein